MATKATLRSPYYPIIYVRGFAATMSEIDEATADPYMGFNRGSTVLRQDYQSKPISFIFESPLLRLMKDHGYIDAFQGGGYLEERGKITPKSIWVFRYYEQASNLLGSGERVTMEQFALDLRRFILRVRDAICGDEKDRKKAFNVHLVAHSMGVNVPELGPIDKFQISNFSQSRMRDYLKISKKTVPVNSSKCCARYPVIYGGEG